MRIGSVRINRDGDNRVPVVPDSVTRLTELGAEVSLETGIGESARISDQMYLDAGATVSAQEEILGNSDILLCLHKPSVEMIGKLKTNSILISFLDPFNDREYLEVLARNNISSICMEMIPRTTLAQKMDALSSQANLAGYVAVIVAADALDKIFPMMTTPAGTLSPSRVFVIGAGVAGLQAIATAKRLGALVEAYDTRPEVEEQVRSLGGRFVKLDIGETESTSQGYAKALTEEQLKMQQHDMTRYLSRSDVVITTAQVFGRKAPRIITENMLEAMKPGSIVVDLAVESGGNVFGSKAGEIVTRNGVKIIGFAPLPSRVSLDASRMYSSNLTNLVSHFWDKENKVFRLDQADEIISGCLVTHGGEICHPMLKEGE
ncbi:MAG: Re/Si-specific NAD(P)(+) transhydrogenase subunit alpha [Acidobacteriota bacterium]